MKYIFITQYNYYRIMTPSAYRLVPFKSHFHYAFFVCKHLAIRSGCVPSLFQNKRIINLTYGPVLLIVVSLRATETIQLSFCVGSTTSER